MEIRDFLRQRREEINISQADLVRRLSLRGFPVTKATVGHWETGRTKPPLKDAEFRLALASALEISVNEMMLKLGYVITGDQYSSEAMLGADIIENLPVESRKRAIELLRWLENQGV